MIDKNRRKVEAKFQNELNQVMDGELRSVKQESASENNYQKQTMTLKDTYAEKYNDMLMKAMGTLEKELSMQGRLQKEEQ